MPACHAPSWTGIHLPAIAGEGASAHDAVCAMRAQLQGISVSILATRGDRTVLILRREGPQAKFDLAAIAKEIARGQANAEPPRVLFDWSGVTAWPFEAPTATSIRFWYSLAPRITRAALVRDGSLDRHASILSALIRAGAAEVKSFPPGYQERAIAWLETPRAPATGPRLPRRAPSDE